MYVCMYMSAHVEVLIYRCYYIMRKIRGKGSEGMMMIFTFLKKSENSLAACELSEPGNPDSAIVSCKKFAISNRTLSSLRFFSSYNFYIG